MIDPFCSGSLKGAAEAFRAFPVAWQSTSGLSNVAQKSGELSTR